VPRTRIEPHVLTQPLDGEPTARACVVGASGFAGALTAAIAWNHPKVALEAVTARSEVGRRLDDLYPRHRVPLELEPFDADRLAEQADVALVSYPHGAAAEVVAELRERGMRIVDLSADFRLHDPALHEHWYGPHGAPALQAEAVFGLTEIHRDAIAGATLVANPGCYATAAILALAPLAREELIADAVVDAKSGVSGAGRAATDTTHYVSVDENVAP
jgi:N-acetyl-gamma-glutamyl-phosphate reductase